VAESVTAGNLQAKFSLASQAISFFQGGITAYNLGQKTRHLGIDPISAARCNCVSELTAINMARGAAALFCSDWGIGVTGYAAPTPEWGIDDNLFAFYAFAYKGQQSHTGKIEVSGIPMREVQEKYVMEILSAFESFVQSSRRN
jgi:nicotinamide-nucleotide amidase